MLVLCKTSSWYLIFGIDADLYKIPDTIYNYNYVRTLTLGWNKTKERHK